MGQRGSKQYLHADGATCLQLVAKVDENDIVCSLCAEEQATCDTSNGQRLPSALFCENCFLQARALTLDRFKAAHLEEANRRRNSNTNGGTSSPSSTASSSAAGSPNSARSPGNDAPSSANNDSSLSLIHI